jgi:hypothetical protein
MPRARRKHRWASIRSAWANNGGWFSGSDERHRARSGKIEGGADPWYLMGGRLPRIDLPRL